jgi:hypothetical protein
VGRVRHFLGFAEDSDARVEDCVGAVFCWLIAGQEMTAQMRFPAIDVGWLERMGVSARVMSQDHSLFGCAAPPGLKPLGVSATQTGTMMPSSSGNKHLPRKLRRACAEDACGTDVEASGNENAASARWLQARVTEEKFQRPRTSMEVTNHHVARETSGTTHTSRANNDATASYQWSALSFPG